MLKRATSGFIKRIKYAASKNSKSTSRDLSARSRSSVVYGDSGNPASNPPMDVQFLPVANPLRKGRVYPKPDDLERVSPIGGTKGCSAAVSPSHPGSIPHVALSTDETVENASPAAEKLGNQNSGLHIKVCSTEYHEFSTLAVCHPACMPEHMTFGQL